MLRPRIVICAAVLVAACSYLLWGDWRRVDRINYVTSLAASAEPPAIGQPDQDRQLIIPGRNDGSFHWLAQTQQMLTARDVRVRHVDYDNAPLGRDVRSTSPYRWYLATLAWLDHTMEHRLVDGAVEWAARWADPILQIGIVLVGTVFVGAQFGLGLAIVFCVGATLVFPYATEFFPGAPDDRSLALAAALGSILLLLRGLRGTPDAATRGRWFAAAGIVGGLGLWISAPVEVPVLLGITLGGCLASWTSRKDVSDAATIGVATAPWRIWAVFGASAGLLGWLADYGPDRLAPWRLDHVHPLYGLAWIAAAELPIRFGALVSSRPQRRRRDWVMFASAGLLLVGLTLVLWRLGNSAFLVRDAASARLDRMADADVAQNSWAWARQAASHRTLWLTLAPLSVLVPAAYLLARRTVRSDTQAGLAVALGPVLVASTIALQQLRWWAVVDATVLVLGTMVAAGLVENGNRWLRWVSAAGALGVAGLGLVRGWPPKSNGALTPITAVEAEEVIVRDLAKWLAFHAGTSGAIVYAPPLESLPLSYYGHLRGIGTFSADNESGFRAAVMIAGASTMEAAQALLQKHQVRYIVIPSWDPFFEEFARLYLAKSLANRPSLLANELRRLNLPPWLTPVTYQIPPIGGFEKAWVLVFEVVEDQSPVVSTSRLADFLVEMNDPARAAAVGQALRKYPGNVGALAALAQVQLAENDDAGAQQTLATVVSLVKAGGDRNLPWDRRVAVAVALGRANAVELARAETERCLAEVDERKLRSLSTNSLHNLLVLARAFELKLPNPKLDAEAVALLPPQMRNGL